MLALVVIFDFLTSSNAVMLALMVIFDLLTSSNAAVMFSLVVPDGPISGPLGSSVVLPCTLSPSLDCKGYKISWYRPNNDDNPVLLYEDLKVQENAGDPQYRGRVSLVGDLQKGNVSLKLENFTLADRGEYVCYVNAYKWYEKASVFTTVTVVGSLPYLSLAEVGDQVNVTCASDGWSPKPTLIWRDKTGKELKNISEYYLKDSEGLVSVRSWLMFSPSDSEWISCSVGLSGQEMKEGRVFPLKTLQSGWNATFIVLLVIFVLGMSLLIFLMKRGNVWKKPSKHPKTDEEAPLVGPKTADKETNTDGEKQADPAPAGSVLNPPEQGQADSAPGAADPNTGVETQAGSASGAADQKTGEVTQGKISPPTCAVFTEREINRAERGTQTSGPETADKEVNTVKEKGPETAEKETSTDGETQADPAPAGSVLNPPEQGQADSASGAADPKTGVETQADPAPGSVLNPPEQGQAGSASGAADPNTGVETQGPETADKEVNTVKEKGPETADKEKNTDGEKQDSASGPEARRTGEETQADSAPGDNAPRTDPASGNEGPGTDGRTQDSHTDTTESIKEKEKPAHPTPDNKDTSTGSASDPPDLSQTQDSKTNNPEINEDKNNAGNLNLESGSASDPPEHNLAQDSNTDNTERTEEKEKPDWNKMLGRKVAIKPESETDLGVLFKERIRKGQYYWQVNGLTGPSMFTPSLRTNQQNKCPESWYVGVISETVLKNQLQLSPQNCWVLHYDKEKGFYVNDPSLPPVPVKDWFFRLGVFIDCEKNTLSFYNCEKSSHLYTFYNVDCTQPLVPVVFSRPQYSFEISKMNCVKCDELYQQYEPGKNNPGPEALPTCRVQSQPSSL